jgi:predicted  nucleic acid-binding Zn-ribbon protein
MPVSAATEKKLREAMRRLLAGDPIHTNGALNKENLAREAGVSHATVHRAETILAEWEARVSKPSTKSPGEELRDERIADLKLRLSKANQAVTELQDKLDALASVTANLYYENQQLRSDLAKSQRGKVVALPASREGRSAERDAHDDPDPGR